jgi:hypothetical protein
VSVEGERGREIVLAVGTLQSSVEHEVRGEVDEDGAVRFGRAGERERRERVDAEPRVRVALGLLHPERRRVHDVRRALRENDALQRGRVENVQLRVPWRVDGERLRGALVDARPSWPPAPRRKMEGAIESWKNS